MSYGIRVAELQRRLRLASNIIENIADERDRDFLLEIVGDYESLTRRVTSALAEPDETPASRQHLRVVCSLLHQNQ